TNWNFGRGLRKQFTLTLTDPAVQWGSPSLAASQERSFTQLGIFISKEFGQRDTTVAGSFPPHEFEMGLDLTRQRQPSPSLLSSGDPIFVDLGISPDSVQRLRSIASSLGVPFRGSDVIAPGLSQSIVGFVGMNTGPWSKQQGIRLNGYWTREGSTDL